MVMTRREAILPCFLTAFGAPLWLFRCSSPTRPDLSLEPDEEMLARAVSGRHNTLRNLAQNPGEEFRIAYGSGKTLTLSFSDGWILHPVLRREDGSVVHMHFSMGYFSGLGNTPSIIFVDESGEVLRDASGERLAFPFVMSRKPARAADVADWIMLGISIVAVGLAAWLGAKIGGLILAAIAFLAFNAMVIGLLITAASVLFPFIEHLLKLTEWNFEAVREFFGKSIEELKAILREVRNSLKFT